MIARLWHGMTPASREGEYLDYLNATGVPELQQTPGNRGVYVMCRTEGDIAHFLLVSLWDSYDAIRQFAGDDADVARYYPGDKDFLLEFEPRVTHYEVLVEPSSLPPGA